MKRAFIVMVGFALLSFSVPGVGSAADPCPAEVDQAKAAVKSAQAALKKGAQVAKGQDIQAPRSQAGSKPQDIQAPRGQQDIQAPKSQQDIQAPRAQDVQAPRVREQDIDAPRVNKAAALVRQAEAACKKGDMAQASRKAKEALSLLK